MLLRGRDVSAFYLRTLLKRSHHQTSQPRPIDLFGRSYNGFILKITVRDKGKVIMQRVGIQADSGAENICPYGPSK